MNFEPGYFYHVYNRGNNSQKTFFNRENYFFFLKKMNEHLSPYVSIVAWCLMPNHFHWVIYVHRNEIEVVEGHAMTSRHSMTKKNGLSTESHTMISQFCMTKDNEISSISHIMAKSHSMTEKTTKTRTLNYSIGVLLRSYTRAIQKQQNLVGSLFQQHTEAKPLDEIEISPAYWNTAFGTLINIPDGKSYLETCIEYVHQNPVSAGLVKNAQDWEFSSFKDYLGLRRGKLIDYELLEKENLLPLCHAMTSRHSMTKTAENKPTPSNQNIADANVTHSMTLSHTMSNICIIGIGSNLDAEKNIPKMLDILKTHVEVIKVSTMLKTKPIGIVDQPDYTNGAVKITTDLNLDELTKLLKSIEDQMGRDRTAPKFGPRNIDLDIVVWNGEIVDEDYYTRDFLQKSVAELL